ncbi:MAG: class II aldolase/adducin family protein, partial [Burkholderiales bacterium]
MKLVSPKAAKRNGEARADSAEWRMRVDLAAAHRIAHHHGLSEGIFNHLTCAIPGTRDRYLQIPFGLHWSEITASCFLEVSYDGKVLK